MNILDRVTKLENFCKATNDKPLRIAFFDPDGIIEPTGLIDDDGVITLRLPDETVKDLQQRAKNNSVWLVGKWHDYINIY